MKIVMLTPRHIILLKKGEYYIKLEKIYESQLPKLRYVFVLAACSILGLMLYFWRVA